MKRECQAIAEKELVAIQNQMVRLEDLFSLNHPVRKALSEARSNFTSVIRVNRTDPPNEQTNWVYLIESEEQL